MSVRPNDEEDLEVASDACIFEEVEAEVNRGEGSLEVRAGDETVLEVASASAVEDVDVHLFFLIHITHRWWFTLKYDDPVRKCRIADCLDEYALRQSSS